MKTLIINSKKHGTFKILLDDDGYDLVTSIGRTNKWCVKILPKRKNLFYFQKRLSSGKLIEMHRLLMDFPEGKFIDHINRNTLDNRKSNLRICTNSANLRNGNVRSNNKSGITGVRYDEDRKKWIAIIKVKYKAKFLGRYASKKQAILARKKAEREFYDS